MTNHKIKKWTDTQGRWMVTCSCRTTGGGPFVAEGDAQAWVFRHERVVAQARAHLARPLTLKAEHAYYVQRSEDPEVPTTEREQWRLLAEGLAYRIRSTESDQPALFDLSNRKRTP